MKDGTLVTNSGTVTITNSEGNSTLVISNVQLSDAGSYVCVSGNTEGSVTSSAAVITVNGEQY